MVSELTRRNLVTVLIFIAALSGCASPLALKPEGIGDYDAAVIAVTSEVADGEAAAQQLRALLAKELELRHVYRQLLHAPAKPGLGNSLLINVEIIRLIYTDDVRRIASGRIARSNEVVARVSLNEYKTGALLSSFRITGVSPARTGILVDWPWGSMDKALARAARQLAIQLQAWSTADQ